jgi:hypothetical protein
MNITNDKNLYARKVHVAGPTRILNIKKSTRSNLYDSLNEGICEIKYTDGSGKKQVKSCTLRKDWVENSKINDWIDHDYETGIIVVWDMSGDEWRGGTWIQIPINNITNFEQLTGVPR